MLRRWVPAAIAFLSIALAAAGENGGTQVAGSRPAAPVLAGCEIDYPPYCSVGPDGEAEGFSVELLRAALHAVGRDVAFKTGTWAEIKEDLAKGRLQALPLVGRTPEREALYDFTFPYLTMHGAIIVRSDNTSIHGPEDLRGKRVAVLKGDNAEEYLRRAGLGAIVVPLPSFATALRELSRGKHDAVVIQRLLAFRLIQQAGLSNLLAVGPPLKDFTQTFCFAVRKGDGPLLAGLNEGLAIAFADGTFRRLRTKWFADVETLGRSKSRIIVGGDSDFPPYEYLDARGQPAGFNVDLTRAIAKKMGFLVEIRLGTWNKIRAGLKDGDIQVVEGMFYSAERDRTYSFSPPHSTVQCAIVTRKGSPPLSDLDHLANKSILVMEGDILHDLALERGLAPQVVSVPSQEDALSLLASGKYDCALVAKVPALYWIKKNGWRNLQVSNASVLSAEYCFAVPPGEEDLLSRFTEGLVAVKASGDYRDIQARWLAPYEPLAANYWRMAKYGAAALLLLLALLTGSLIWSRSLKRLVALRTRELGDEVAEKLKAQEALARSRELAAVGKLAQALAHEVRNPLFALQVNAAVVAKATRDREDLRPHIDHMDEQIRRLSSLTGDILELGKPPGPEMHVECSLPDLAMAALAELDRRMPGKSDLVDVSVRDEPLLKANAGQIVQALAHLLQNAIQVTPEGRRVSMEAEANSERCLIRVRDRGPGLPKVEIEQIFEPFWTTRQGHRGLGLALARHYVTAHGGSLTASDNDPPPGATFTAALPVSR